MKEIAIVGGGPAGSLCGERLAQAGFDVTIYDEHLAWEKPCGGGLTHKAIRAYPFLLESTSPKRVITEMELVAPEGQRARMTVAPPIVIYSRAVLNGLLLDRAARAGCRVVRARVTQIDAGRLRPSLSISGIGTETFDFVVLAAGARNALLPDTRPLEPEDLEMTLGYFVPAQSTVLKVKFPRQFQGYVWSFPRCDHLSLGICGSMARHSMAELRRHLETFAREEGIPLDGARLFSHVLPSPRGATLRERSVAGRNWALAGDAAGWVDPITGEGLYYALRSGELLAESVCAGAPLSYPARAWAEFGSELAVAAQVAERFYRGRFLLGAVTTRMVQFARRSATFRALLGDIFRGAQDYRTLKARLWRQLARTLAELSASFFHSSPMLASTEARDALR